MRAALENLLAAGRDDALLRFSLGGACLKEGDAAAAADHLRHAIGHDPNYSAAWKLLGQALLESGQVAEAADAWERGVGVAESRGDVQAAKEMRVFAKRARKQARGPE
jgi:Tfp pilus assembly protein PilF